MNRDDCVSISSGDLHAVVMARGAQLCSVTDRRGHEYLWQPDANIWNDSAPFLFPYVGKSRKDSVEFDGRRFPMPVHGFAGTERWVCTKQSGGAVTFRLEDSQATRMHYPFSFAVDTTYQIKENELTICRKICNTGAVPMPFTMGEHIGLRTNLQANAELDDHKFRFQTQEEPVRITTTRELLACGRTPMPLQSGRELRLCRENFREIPVVILEIPRSAWVELFTDKGPEKVRLTFGRVPYLIFWTPVDRGEFVCVEPCWGTSSWTDETLDGYRRHGVIVLPAGAWRSYEMRLAFEPA